MKVLDIKRFEILIYLRSYNWRMVMNILEIPVIFKRGLKLRMEGLRSTRSIPGKETLMTHSNVFSGSYRS